MPELIHNRSGVGSMIFNATVQAGATGGTFEPGAARLVVQLYSTANGTQTDLDEKTYDVTLLPPDPTITSIIPASTDLVFADGALTTYSAEIENTGPNRTGMGFQAWIRQGSASLAAGGGPVRCSGGPLGEIPTGTCAATGNISSSPSNTGIGTLVLGAATLEVELKYNDGTVNAVIGKFTVPVTLVAP